MQEEDNMKVVTKVVGFGIISEIDVIKVVYINRIQAALTDSVVSWIHRITTSIRTLPIIQGDYQHSIERKKHTARIQLIGDSCILSPSILMSRITIGLFNQNTDVLLIHHIVVFRIDGVGV